MEELKKEDEDKMDLESYISCTHGLESGCWCFTTRSVAMPWTIIDPSNPTCKKFNDRFCDYTGTQLGKHIILVEFYNLIYVSSIN